MKQILLTLIIVSFSVLGYTQQASKSTNAPVSDLGHIDVILDSTTWYAIRNNSFIQNEFGVLNIDTAYYGKKPSYDIYVLGQLNFLHLSLAKAFWNDQQGGGVLVFQTQKPEQKEILLNSWKQFYKDSLFVHSFKGNDYTLNEIMAWYKPDSTKPKKARMFANLTTYSADAYKNWGITDSMVKTGLVMKQFMNDWGGEPLKSRLFNSITELYMTINKQEFKEIESSLLAVGYRESKNNFTHPSKPAIYISISEENTGSKYSKVKFKLNRSVAEKEIIFSPIAKLKLSGNEGWFVFN